MPENRGDEPELLKLMASDSLTLPMRLPADMPWRPRMTATSEVANSGEEVPAATIVTPMTHSETPTARWRWPA